MIDSQYIFPATLSALTILATVLNFTAHFSGQRNNLRDFIFKHII